jgi:hypothetical protein
MAAADGLPEFVTPYNTSEFEEMVRAVIAHSNAMKGQAEVVGHDLRRLLPRAKNVAGRAGMFGLDLRVAAIQVGRQFNQIAAAENAAAAAASKALTFYHGNFVSPTSGGHGRGFDASK